MEIYDIRQKSTLHPFLFPLLLWWNFYLSRLYFQICHDPASQRYVSKTPQDIAVAVYTEKPSDIARFMVMIHAWADSTRPSTKTQRANAQVKFIILLFRESVDSLDPSPSGFIFLLGQTQGHRGPYVLLSKIVVHYYMRSREDQANTST